MNGNLARVFKCSGTTSEDFGEYSSKVIDCALAQAAASKTRAAAFMGFSEYSGARAGRIQKSVRILALGVKCFR
jgi:nanoRNase/pAp phosphatase (c-di-AMP/oligoRNAs hydrolase)